MYRIPYLSTARFSGEEAGAFLQSQLSADIEALQEGQSTFACYCTPKGQVLGLLLVQRSDDCFLVAAAAPLLEGMLQRLGMFVFRTRVTLEASPEIGVYGSRGPRYAFAGLENESEIATDEWKAHELRNGICWLDEATREKFIPQMLGYDEIEAVSFSKGCYPGQEIVARARYLGKVKRKPLLLVVEGEPNVAPGERIEVSRDGSVEAVTLVDAASPRPGHLLLFCVARAEPENAVESVLINEVRYGCATM